MICRQSVLEVRQELRVPPWLRVHSLDHLFVHLAIVQFNTVNESIGVPVSEYTATASSAFAVLKLEAHLNHLLRVLSN